MIAGGPTQGATGRSATGPAAMDAAGGSARRKLFYKIKIRRKGRHQGSSTPAVPRDVRRHDETPRSIPPIGRGGDRILAASTGHWSGEFGPAACFSPAHDRARRRPGPAHRRARGAARARARRRPRATDWWRGLQRAV